jgi:hypothetical protein
MFARPPSRKASGIKQPPSLLTQMRDELRARLLVHDPATQAVRNVYAVYKEMGGNGWQGVAALPHLVLGRALAEAEMLDIQDPSPMLALVIEQLRELEAGARAHAPPEEIRPDEEEWEAPVIPEVSETTYEEWELMERSWIGTVPSGLMELPEAPR